jgi:hypothetical protein
MKDGVATIGVSGEVALLAGVEINTSVSVDTKPVQQAAVVTAQETVKVTNTVANETTKAANTVANETTKAANTVANGVTDTAKKAGKALNPKNWKF